MPKEIEPVNSDVLLLISRPSLQATALVHQLKTSIAINVKIQNIQKTLDNINAERILVLFDLSESDKKRTLLWQTELRRLRDKVKVLLINMPEDYPFHEVESWPGISAVFYLSVDEQTLIEGIRNVRAGGCHFPHDLTSYLINQSGNYRYHDDTSGLTQREKDILNKLRMGASNIEIARLLFISENTVKTHLYNLFRKIAVKNRTQAVTWANDNLRR
ncbi:biofilm master transcriptional regulator CsgD [Kluyvera cryocrescens]|uniref:biofilm master transcriptional regulator CsgD n=1 Tax=Kluyvera cryocrescens TaxID=580 RepID=UPI00224ABE73|nr:biofilm master transcriptional regulator CsgD [Kluyvera cryocrescens]MCX2865966.1 biofilm master transcriptional regulator CsgD [Kluyvera cryocrescens]